MRLPGSRCAEPRRPTARGCAGLARAGAAALGGCAALAQAAPAHSGPGGPAWLALGGWLLVAVLLLFGGWRLNGVLRREARLRQALAAAEAEAAARGERLSKLREALRALGEGLGSLEQGSDFRRTALEELEHGVGEAAARLQALHRALQAGAPPPTAAPQAAPEVLLEQLEPALAGVGQRATDIGEKFARLHDRADDINRAVAALAKVSERINLLSLNAAIESEKAGERGHGFVAIAREIRRLADHTASASLGIERQVARAREVIDEGVMTVERFEAEVRGGQSEMRQLWAQALSAPAAGGAADEREAEVATPGAVTAPGALEACETALERLRVASRGLGQGEEKLQSRLAGLSHQARALLAGTGAPASSARRGAD